MFKKLEELDLIVNINKTCAKKYNEIEYLISHRRVQKFFIIIIIINIIILRSNTKKPPGKKVVNALNNQY